MKYYVGNHRRSRKYFWGDSIDFASRPIYNTFLGLYNFNVFICGSVCMLCARAHACVWRGVFEPGSPLNTLMFETSHQTQFSNIIPSVWGIVEGTLLNHSRLSAISTHVKIPIVSLTSTDISPTLDLILRHQKPLTTIPRNLFLTGW